MALITTVAGAYTTTYTPNSGGGASGAGGGALAQGITTDDGFQLVWAIHKQRIGNDGTDRYGQTLLEGVYRGADWRLIYRCREYSANNMNAAWPYGRVAAGGPLYPHMGVISRLDSQIEGGIIMTAVTGTPAATNPATLSAPHVAQNDGTAVHLNFTSRERQLPVDLVLYPYSATIDAVPYELWFVTT